MRRKDRQVSDLNEIVSIVGKCGVCRLGLSDEGMPYIVPMNFGYEFDGAKLTLYFHSAKEGRKIDILRQNPRVCFEMDCGHELIKGTRACDYGYGYASVIGFGNAAFVYDRDEKAHALNRIMSKYTEKGNFNFSSEELDAVTVIRVQASDYTAKKR